MVSLVHSVLVVFFNVSFFFACEVYAQAVSCYLRFACEIYAQAHVEHASFAPRLCGFVCELHAQARQTFCVRGIVSIASSMPPTSSRTDLMDGIA